jgi:hypothetical protein
VGRRLIVGALLVGMFSTVGAPVSAHPRPTDQRIVGWASAITTDGAVEQDCAVVTIEVGPGGTLRGMAWENGCSEAHLVAGFQFDRRNGTRSGYHVVVTPPDSTIELRGRGLQELGARDAVGVAQMRVEASDPPARGPALGTLTVYDVDGRIVHRTGPTAVRTPLEREQLVAVTGGVAGDQHWYVRAHPKTRHLTEMVLVNGMSELYGHHVFEVWYANGTASQRLNLVTPPDSTVTVGREVLARIGVRGAVVGIDVYYLERTPEYDDWGPYITVLDRKGRIVHLHERHVHRR